VRRHLTEFVVGRFQRALETGRILRYLVLTIAGVAFGFGLLMWIVDREDFPTLGLALWWAVSTVTTVGYGDVVPVEPTGQAVAAALMIFGYASLSMLTGIVASTLVSRAAAASSEALVARLENRLAEVERLLRQQVQ
jgi:voltage-gated potassium channel